MKSTYHYVGLAILACILGVTALPGCGTGTSDHESLEGGFARIKGETMGTTYTIIYHPDTVEGVKNKVDKLLVDINHSLSTYEDNSLISQINASNDWNASDYITGDSTARLHRYFNDCFQEAYRVFRASRGAFDPTVGPLVRYWGFGWEKQKPEHADKHVVDSLTNLVGMGKLPWAMQEEFLILTKGEPGMMLDFSALAKGYAVDQVARLLNLNGILRYMIEIGGEVKAYGRNQDNEDWRLGIQMPKEDAGLEEIYSRVGLHNRAMATSGNYRNYYILDGKKVFHTISPRIGYPMENNLRSATIIHPSCMTADALATASMVMGTNEAVYFIQREPDAEGYFIYEDDNGVLQDTMTTGFKQYLLN